ncbi:hypothetical protein JEQ12_003660 [Ovis aries]|uniref:Uncharacterized protein n=1 Tax=Ovis aries TaxID=9940 RepID=A0A836A8I7_SHEEP|nr:hypothetical protein JEQ12_003660 [Ovis aries]
MRLQLSPLFVDSEMKILKIIVEMFLPHMNHLTLEQTFFSQVLPKTVRLFDDMMYELTSQARELSSQNLEIQSTLRNILQNSESVYSGRLHLVADLLQALFKEAYSLQKQLMELLDMVCMNPLIDEHDDILNMVVVIHSLLDICSVISSMDHAFHANTWKFIIKQSLKHQSVIKSQLKHKDIITSLCEDILFSFHACLRLAEQMMQSDAQDNADYRLFQKTLKLCRFFANSLLHYTKVKLIFLIMHECEIYNTFKFPPSLYAAGISKPQQEEIAGTFLVTLSPLISQLLTFQPFVDVVLDSKLELPCELQFPQCLLLVVIMDELSSRSEDVQALWCTESQVSEATARYGTAELCAHHVTITAHLVEFIQKFPPKETENLLLWQYISFQALPAELRKQTALEVSRAGIAWCMKWLGSNRTLEELESLNTVLSALLAVCNSSGEALDMGQQMAIKEVGSQLSILLNVKLVIGQPYVQQTLSLLLPLLGFFIQALDPQLISQTGFVDETTAARVERIKQEKGTFWEPFAKVIQEGTKMPSLQPCAKRARHELPSEDEYRSTLQAAIAALEAIELLLQKSPPPDWLLMEMETLQERIDKLKRQVLSGLDHFVN